MKKELKQLLELKTLENVFVMVGLLRNEELLFRDVYRQCCESLSGLDINLTPDEGRSLVLTLLHRTTQCDKKQRRQKQMHWQQDIFMKINHHAVFHCGSASPA